MNSSYIRRFRWSSSEEINANCGRAVTRSTGKCPIQRITKEMGSAAYRHHIPHWEQSPGRPNGNIGPFLSPESGSWSVTQSLAGTRSRVWFFQIIRSVQRAELNWRSNVPWVAAFALLSPSVPGVLWSISFQVLCSQRYRILFAFIWAWAVSWAFIAYFIPQLEINLIKAFQLCPANTDSFWHVFSVMAGLKWKLESWCKRMRVEASFISPSLAWSGICGWVRRRSWDQRSSAIARLLQKQIWGVRAFIQNPVGFFVDLAASPGVALPSWWFHLNKP